MFVMTRTKSKFAKQGLRIILIFLILDTILPNSFSSSFFFFSYIFYFGKPLTMIESPRTTKRSERVREGEREREREGERKRGREGERGVGERGER